MESMKNIIRNGDDKMLELIQQENIKIEPHIDFNVDKFKCEDNNKFVVFCYDEKVKRNRYEILCIRKCSVETLDKLNEESYRGNIETSLNGVLPLFVFNFPYPLYSLIVKYRKVVDGFDTYISMRSPITFKLKGKEDRLCFDVHIKEYSDITTLCNDEFLTSNFKKAVKIEIPNT